MTNKGIKHSRQLFFRNELAAMTAGSWRKKLTLPAFVFLALLGVTFSISGLDYLELKMSDPYVKWVDFPISMDVERSGRYPVIIDSLTSWASKERKHLTGFTGYYRESLEFYGAERLSPYTICRTIDPIKDSLLLNRILHPDQIVMDNRPHFLDEYGGDADYMWRKGIVLSEDLYQQLFGDKQSLEVIGKRGYTMFPCFDVLAVVKRLPGRRTGFMCTHSLMWSLANPEESKLRNDAYVDTVSILLDRSNLEGVTSVIEQNSQLPSSIEVESIELLDYKSNALSHSQRAVIYLSDELDFERRKSFFKDLEKGLRKWNPAFHEEFDYRSHKEIMEIYELGKEKEMFNYLSLGFEKLDSIRPFSTEMLSELKIELDLNRVESLENYRMVSLLTKSLGALLLFFALISIVIFVFNLVTSHLESIKGNLGTFRAFGLTKQFLVQAYLRIVFSVLTVSIGSSLLLLVVIGYSGILNSTIRMLTFDAELSGMTINFTNLWVVFLIIALYTSAYIVTRLSVNRILSHSPGDLIYGRS